MSLEATRSNQTGLIPIKHRKQNTKIRSLGKTSLEPLNSDWKPSKKNRYNPSVRRSTSGRKRIHGGRRQGRGRRPSPTPRGGGGSASGTALLASVGATSSFKETSTSTTGTGPTSANEWSPLCASRYLRRMHLTPVT